MTESPLVERLLQRDRAITLAGIIILCVLAWLHVLTGAGLGMSAREMTTLSLFPHLKTAVVPADMPGMALQGMASGHAAWSLSTWALMAAMWWIMMVAMMSPSAAPAILLYARVYRHAADQGQMQSGVAPTGAFAAGYLLAWLGFSIAATGLHSVFERTGLVSAMMMSSQSSWLSGSVLIAAGLYQMSPLKHACLGHCRSPAQFLTQHWRPGSLGALRLGALHGAYCVGCCWVLMALLFVGGVMNLIWIAALAILVLLEKVAPRGQWFGMGVGVILILWGVATFYV